MKKGFTLIELMISMVIFVIFLGVVSNSYVSIVRAQRQANEVRKIYSDLRNMIQTLNEEIRLGAIDYDCYPNSNFTTTSSDLAGTAQTAPAAIDTSGWCVSSPISGDGHVTDLFLLKNDGLEKTEFSYNVDQKNLTEKKWIKNEAGFQLVSDSNADGSAKSLLSDSVKLDQFAFVISPTVNPYSSDSKIYANNSTQFQPKVTVLFSAKADPSIDKNFSFDFQTTISSRVYSRAQ